MGGYGNHEHMHYPHAPLQSLCCSFSLFFALRRSLLPLCFSDEIWKVYNADINITSLLVNRYEFSLFFFLFFINIHE